MNHRQITVRKGNFKREMAAAKISLWAHHNFFFTHFFSFISLPVTVAAVLFLLQRVLLPFFLLCWQQQFLQFLKFFYGPAAIGVVIKFLT